MILHHREESEYPECVMACFTLNDTCPGKGETKEWDGLSAWMGAFFWPAHPAQYSLPSFKVSFKI